VATHKYSGASVLVESELSAQRLAEICTDAAEVSGVTGQFIRLEEAKPNQLIFSVRSRTTGGRVELMTFRVSHSEDADWHSMESKISSFETSRQRVLGLIPLPKILVGYKPYKKFMTEFAASVKDEDPSAITSIVESEV
jgi:hypothetical protein